MTCLRWHGYLLTLSIFWITNNESQLLHKNGVLLSFIGAFLWGYRRDYSVYALSQWETALQCNTISPWLGAYTIFSLLLNIHICQFNGADSFVPLSSWRIYSISNELCTGFCFDLFCLYNQLLPMRVMRLHVFFWVTSLALAVIYVCPNAREVTLKDVGKTTGNIMKPQENKRELSGHGICWLAEHVPRNWPEWSLSKYKTQIECVFLEMRCVCACKLGHH